MKEIRVERTIEQNEKQVDVGVLVCERERKENNEI